MSWTTGSLALPALSSEDVCGRDRRDHPARIDDLDLDLDLEAHARDELLRPRRGVEHPLAPRARQDRSESSRAKTSSVVPASPQPGSHRGTRATALSVGSSHQQRRHDRARASYPAGLPRGKKGTRVNIKKVTPLLVVDRIEPSLRFYEKLGYTAVISVPHDDHLGFVLLAQDLGQVMLQTRSSLAADLPAISRTGVSSLLYIDVESLEEALMAAAGSSEVLVPMRTTAYGAREAFVREPSGQIVGFAEEVTKPD